MDALRHKPGARRVVFDLTTNLRAWRARGTCPRWFRLVCSLGGCPLPVGALLRTLGYKTQTQLKSDVLGARFACFQIFEQLDMDGTHKWRVYWLGRESLMLLEAHRKMIPDAFI